MVTTKKNCSFFGATIIFSSQFTTFSLVISADLLNPGSINSLFSIMAT